jgi:uncharacterized protein (DUF433 family)
MTRTKTTTLRFTLTPTGATFSECSPTARAVHCTAMTRDANALLRDALQLPAGERQEIAARLLAQESSVVSADPRVMSGAPVFRGTRVLVQTLIEHLEAGDSIDDFLEGFPSVTREQVIAFLEEMKARVVAYAE